MPLWNQHNSTCRRPRKRRYPRLERVNSSLGRFVSSAFADTKNVAVRMPHVHLANIPGHICRREYNLNSSSHALLVGFVNVIHPHGHPHALVRRFVSARAKCRNIRSLAAAPLPSPAKKNLAFTGPDRAESGRHTPIPALSPAPLLEPRDARGDVGNIQYWRDMFHIHARNNTQIPSAGHLKLYEASQRLQ
jgi:hypothetical protein